METKYTGAVVHFIPRRGFGFIYSSELNRRIFFHATHWHRSTLPVAGELVSFNLKDSGVEGQPDKAVDVYPQSTAITTGITALVGEVRQ
jgi:cold shock CspA family protein